GVQLCLLHGLHTGVYPHLGPHHHHRLHGRYLPREGDWPDLFLVAWHQCWSDLFGAFCFQVLLLFYQQLRGSGRAVRVAIIRPINPHYPAYWPLLSHLPEPELCRRSVSWSAAGGDELRDLCHLCDVLSATGGWPHRTAPEPALPVL